jgi:hypothetical protein
MLTYSREMALTSVLSSKRGSSIPPTRVSDQTEIRMRDLIDHVTKPAESMLPVNVSKRTHISFQAMLGEVSAAAADDRLPNIVVVYDHYDLWGFLPSRITGAAPGRITDSGRSLQSIETILWDTYWFKRLRNRTRATIMRKIKTRRKSGLLWLKNILYHCDGMLLSLYLGFGELFVKDCDYRISDQVMKSIISNCVLGDKEYMPRMKAWKKRFRKGFFSGKLDTALPQDFSYLLRFVKTFKSAAHSRQTIMRLGLLTQTRNTGLPDVYHQSKSADKFRETLETPCSEIPVADAIRIDKILEEIILQEPTVAQLEFQLSCSRESISSTGCREQPKVKGGKTAYARVRLASKPVVFAYDLETGQSTRESIPVTSLGEWLFHDALSVIHLVKAPDIMEATFIQVREPGLKWRSATSSSYYHALILQPYSHLCLNLLSIFEETRDGVKAARHGWLFSKRLTTSDASRNWHYFGGKNVEILSTDLETSTDYLDWYVVRTILRSINRLLKIPTWYGNLVIRLLTEPRKIFRNGKLWFTTKRGCLMGDPVTKVILTFVGLIALRWAGHRLSYIASIVGDDIVVVTTTPKLLDKVQDCLVNVLHMKLSVDDTYVSSMYAFFAEEIIVLPQSFYDTYDSIVKSRHWGRLPYIDFPKIRLLLDVKKDREDFSSSPVGKISAYGKDIGYCKPNLGTAIFHLGSLFQDVCLRLRDGKQLAYFPYTLSGVGRPPLFWREENFVSFWGNCRGGKYLAKVLALMDQIAGYASVWRPGDTIPHFGSTWSNMFRHDPSEPWICQAKGLVDTERFQAFRLGPVPKYGALSHMIYHRLRNWVVPESYLIGKIASEQWFLNLIFNDVVDISQPVDAETFLPDIEIPETCRLRAAIAIWKDNPEFLASLKPDVYYDREVLEQFEFEYTLAVQIKTIVVPHERVKRVLDPDRRIDDLYNWVVVAKERTQTGGFIPDIPLDYLDDDPFIRATIALGEPGTDYLIVTEDRKLIKQINWENVRSKKRAYMIPSRIYAAMMLLMDDTQSWIATFVDKMNCFKVELLIDTGSFNFALEIQGRDGFRTYDRLFTDEFTSWYNTEDVLTLEIPADWPEAYLLR